MNDSQARESIRQWYELADELGPNVRSIRLDRRGFAVVSRNDKLGDTEMERLVFVKFDAMPSNMRDLFDLSGVPEGGIKEVPPGTFNVPAGTLKP